MGKIIKEAWKSNVWLRFLTVFSAILVIAGFFVPPIGEISGSVLTALGELGFFGILFIIDEAIQNGNNVTVKHNNTEVGISDRDEGGNE